MRGQCRPGRKSREPVHRVALWPAVADNAPGINDMPVIEYGSYQRAMFSALASTYAMTLLLNEAKARFLANTAEPAAECRQPDQHHQGTGYLGCHRRYRRVPRALWRICPTRPAALLRGGQPGDLPDGSAGTGGARTPGRRHGRKSPSCHGRYG